MKKYVDKIRLSIINGSFFSVIGHALKKRWKIHFISNNKVLDYQMQDLVFKKLKREFGYIIDRFSISEGVSHQHPKIIWVLWLQGIEQAPELIQACVSSMKKNLSTYEVRVLNEENINKYVDIPEKVVEKWKKGIIYNAHFSDLVRVSILSQYGGTWIDSTVLCTAKKEPKYLEEPLFLYKSLLEGSDRVVAGNWLISAEANNPIILLVKKLLYAYWDKKNVADHYYFFHMFFTMAAEKFPEIWEKVPSYNDVSPHMLSFEIKDKYCEDRYNEIIRMSDFHKLNHKEGGLKINDGSFYDIVIHKKNSNSCKNYI